MSGGAENRSVQDRFFDEWKECRASIERFDKLIADLRKYGFTLVTTLVTADAVFFSTTEVAYNFGAVLAVSIVCMILVIGLFVVDRYHEVFLRSVVIRAKWLEKHALKMYVTRSITAGSVSTDTYGLHLYTILMVASTLPGLLPALTWKVSPASQIATNSSPLSEKNGEAPAPTGHNSPRATVPRNSVFVEGPFLGCMIACLVVGICVLYGCHRRMQPPDELRSLFEAEDLQTWKGEWIPPTPQGPGDST